MMYYFIPDHSLTLDELFCYLGKLAFIFLVYIALINWLAPEKKENTEDETK